MKLFYFLLIFFKKKCVFKTLEKIDVLIIDDGFSKLNLNGICSYKLLEDDLYIKALFYSIF